MNQPGEIGAARDRSERSDAREERQDRRPIRHMALAADIGLALTRSAPLRDTLQRCMEAIVEHLDAAFARVWTVDPSGKLLELQASAGMYTHTDGAHARVPVGALKIGLIAEERQPHLTNDVLHDPRVGDPAWARREGMVAFAGYPLLLEDRVVGVMALFARAPLDATTLDALASVADVLAIGIERRRADEARRVSFERFRFLGEAMPHQVWTARPDGTIEYVNERLASYFGMSAEEAVARGWGDLLHPDDRAAAAAAWRHAKETGDPFELELRLRRADGEYRWHIARAVGPRNADGAIAGWYGTNTDIDERKQAESALAEREHRYMQILDSVQDMVFCKRRDLVVSYANAAACRYYGATAEQLRGIVRDDPEHTRRYLADDRKVFETGEVVEVVDEPNVRSDGETRYFHTIKSPIVDASGTVVEIVGVSRDVTEVKRARDAQRFLVEATEMLASSIDWETTLANVTRMAVPTLADWCSVDLVDDAGAIRRLAVAHVDPAKVRLAEEIAERWPPDPSATSGLPQVVRTQQSEILSDISEEVLAQTAMDPELRHVLRELGLRSSMCVPITCRGRSIGAITLVSAESKRRYGPNDLALAEELARRAGVAVENARLYAEVKQLNASLEKRVEERTSQLLEANKELEAFSYTVSHDLRAPIRHVGGFADLLDRHAGKTLDEKSRRYLDTIRDSAKQMGTLIDALLAFSRMGRSELATASIDLGEVVSQVRRDLEPDCEERDIAWDIGPLPVVRGDPTMVRQVIANLVSNAVKYTRPRATAHIQVGALDDGEPEMATVFVRDDGVGFDMRYASKLFGVFQRLHTDREFEGTGIGLANVRRIVQRHGGRAWAESQPGRGSTFYVTLPRAGAHSRTPA